MKIQINNSLYIYFLKTTYKTFLTLEDCLFDNNTNSILSMKQNLKLVHKIYTSHNFMSKQSKGL